MHASRFVCSPSSLCCLLLLPALLGALRNRRVQAAIKYWGVLMVMMVGTLLLMYFVPVTAFFGPSFGYTLAAVGMSDRVESTVFKVGLHDTAQHSMTARDALAPSRTCSKQLDPTAAALVAPGST